MCGCYLARFGFGKKRTVLVGDLVVGESSDIKIGKKVYKGKVSAIGKFVY